MAQPPVPPYQPPFSQQKQKRGPVVLLVVLVLVLVVVAAIGTVVILRRDDNHKKPAAVATKPSTPEAVEFRRVLTVKTGTCPSPAPASTFCDADGMRYTLGKVELNGSHVSEVKAAMSSQGTSYWYVGLTLDDAGKQLFGQLTTALAKNQPPANQLAIVVGNEVVTAPSVNSPITAGQIEISGSYTRDQVEALAAKITG